MDKTIKPILGLALLFLLSACSETFNPEGKWKYEKFTKSDRVFSLHQSDSLSLQNDGTFWYRLYNLNKYATGSWAYTNDTLKLNYDAVPKSWAVDSIVPSDSLIYYFYQGKKIREVDLVQAKSVTRNFVTQSHTENQWVFTEGELVFTYSK